MSIRICVTGCLAVAAFLVFTGCAAPASSPSARMDRVDNNRDEYETWPLPVKEAILDGRVVKGMTPKMVEVALGEPAEVVVRDNNDEVWIYREKRESSSGGSSPLSNMGGSVSIGGGTGGFGTGVGISAPISLGGGGGYQEPPIEREVAFRNGVVVHGDDVK